MPWYYVYNAAVTPTRPAVPYELRKAISQNGEQRGSRDTLQDLHGCY